MIATTTPKSRARVNTGQIDTVPVKAKLAEWDQKVAEWDPKQDLENRLKNHANWIKRQKEQRLGFYAAVPFLIELEGGYHDIAKFFERLSRLPRIVNVGSLKITSEEGVSQSRLNTTKRTTIEPSTIGRNI